jgi:hypothetical protein
MSSYSQDRKAEIALEVWPFLHNGEVGSDYVFSYQEDSDGSPANPAIIKFYTGERVSPNGWDGDTTVRDGGNIAYRHGYISGSLAPNEAALNRYFKQEGEIKSASERYADKRRREALAKKIFFGVAGALLLGLGIFVYFRKTRGGN